MDAVSASSFALRSYISLHIAYLCRDKNNFKMKKKETEREKGRKKRYKEKALYLNDKINRP